MANPEDRGNPAVPVMELIMQLEKKIKEKNEIITSLENDVNDWRMKFLLAISIQSPLFWVGMIVGQAPWIMVLAWWWFHGK